ncbi:MAG TPA: Yip1 family protein [Caulobacteraceae bacterium]|jgi:type II secretory pathway pseudopilin PulG|nr:Yip1 family protein [Caulobacteraceae bacterium]
MSTADPTPGPIPSPTSLIARAQAILFKPTAVWDEIDAEPATVRGLFTGYAAILAAIPALSSFLGSVAFSALFGAYGLVRGLISGLVTAVLMYALSLVSVFILSLLIDALTPSFDGTRDATKATKVAVYTATATWVGGVLLFLPVLGALLYWAGFVYTCVLLYFASTKLMRPPADKAAGLGAVTIVIAVVLNGILWWVRAIVGAILLVSLAFAMPVATGTIHVGNASVNLAQLNQAAQAAQAASQAMQAQANGQPPPAGSVKAVPADQLKSLLPDNISGLPRTDLSSTSGSVAGLSGSNAEATYSAGPKRITLGITDIAGMGAMASLASAFSVESDHETQTGYDRVSRVNGNMTEEEFDRQSNSGKYSVLVASRFVVEAQGSGIAIDDLKGAVNAVGIGRLQGMVHS